MAAPPAPEATIKLRCSDGKEFEADRRLARTSNTVRRLIVQRDDPRSVIALPSVGSSALPKVIEYCYMHAGAAAVDDDEDGVFKEWDANFIKVFDKGELFELLLAASYLDIKGLVNLTCRAMKEVDQAERKRVVKRKRAACALWLAYLVVVVLVLVALVYYYLNSD